MQEDAEVRNEDAVKTDVLPVILKAMDASRGAQKIILFNNIPPITNNIVQAQPDYYYGAQPEQLDPRVREKLSKDIIPLSSIDLPSVPN